MLDLHRLTIAADTLRRLASTGADPETLRTLANDLDALRKELPPSLTFMHEVLSQYTPRHRRRVHQ